MADNVSVTAGAGTTVATDDIGGAHYQRVKVALGPDGTYTADADGTAARGQYVDPRPDRQIFTITPTIDTNIFASGDCLGALNTIASASRAAGIGGYIESITVLDKTQAQRAAFDILLFNQSVSSAGNNAPAAFTDADMANCIGIISILAADYNTAWPGTPLNSFAFKPDTKVAANPQGMHIPYYCSGSTSLYVQFVVRGTPTYTTSADIVVTLNCVLD